MIRNKAASSMQKTYDDCYLMCSTAVYFESHNNESEALRSWREALDAIYYHNAYKLPSGWRPRTSTEKALQDSLRQMEIRCKERVDLLSALRESRTEAKRSSVPDLLGPIETEPERVRTPGWLGDGTVQPADYASIPRVAVSSPPTAPPPPLPLRPAEHGKRPGMPNGRSSSDASVIRATTSTPSLLFSATSGRSENPRKESRTPSPEKKGGMLRTLRTGKDRRESGGARNGSGLRGPRPPVAAKAATQAWSSTAYNASEVNLVGANENERKQYEEDGHNRLSGTDDPYRSSLEESARPDILRRQTSSMSIQGDAGDTRRKDSADFAGADEAHVAGLPPTSMSYRQEYPPSQPSKYTSSPLATPPRRWDQRAASAPTRTVPPSGQQKVSGPNRIPRKAAGVVAAVQTRQKMDHPSDQTTQDNHAPSTPGDKQRPTKPSKPLTLASPSNTHPSPSADLPPSAEDAWLAKKARVLASLPANIDTHAATQILNEVVVRGDPVAWSDISGLTTAKLALKENVIYPFLRPDLFRGLREPARGILLFGPPGTGKTMLARAVATESKSTFFSIGAGSLTSKFLGESEKLVRALFAAAKACGPSIVFIDEIESLLGRRGEGGHEALERVKTEFLVGWSDLQRAAAGGGADVGLDGAEEGDASRVLVLAATNLPWLIDEAARRRFVRRQYIPLPEEETRRSQLEKLLERQRCNVSVLDLDRLVVLTDGFSGSDITSLAKDAAMGPLRELGERLLDTSPEDIRAISFDDFRASLANIRPSVSKGSLREFEEWAAEFGERGG